MNLYLDTETTGLPNDALPITDPIQPWPIEIGAILEDGEGQIAGELSLIIKPEGFTIPASVTKINGITMDYAKAMGVPLHQALKLLHSLAACAKTVVTFNALFDLNVIEAACHRCGLPAFLNSKQHYCAMRAYNDKFGGKWPKLAEAYHAATGKTHNAHTAMGDARACRIVTHWLNN